MTVCQHIIPTFGSTWNNAVLNWGSSAGTAATGRLSSMEFLADIFGTWKEAKLASSRKEDTSEETCEGMEESYVSAMDECTMGRPAKDGWVLGVSVKDGWVSW